MRLAWSNLAKQELIDLRRYSIERWGREVAQRYLDDVRDAAKLVAREPHRARRLNDRLQILRVRSHYLIVRVDAAENRLVVARVLHVAMDIGRHLP